MAQLPQVWNCGGGTQSIAIAALIVSGLLPKPDHALMADTGREKAEVWTYFDSVLVPNLAKVGVDLKRLSRDQWAYNHDDLFNKSGTLLLPAYSNIDGAGKLPNFCTTYWKVDVIRNYMRREHRLTQSMYVNWIGFSMNEFRRYSKLKKSKRGLAGLLRFPLVDDVPMVRESAIAFVTEKMGWPKPPRSACYMCPNKTDAEWLETDPVEFGLSVALEKDLRKRDPNAFLHKSMKPLSEVVFSKTGMDSTPCESGQCFL